MTIVSLPKLGKLPSGGYKIKFVDTSFKIHGKFQARLGQEEDSNLTTAHPQR